MSVEYIACAICGKKLSAIGTHFMAHGLTCKEYKEKFPEAKLYSKQILKKFSESGYFGNIGKKRNYIVSKETRQKISQKNRGQTRSEEVKQRMKDAQKTRWEEYFKKYPKQPKQPKPQKPKVERKKHTYSEEEKRKTSERMKKQWRDGKMKNVTSPMAQKRRTEAIRDHWKTHEHPEKGTTKSEETKQRLREGHRRGLVSLNSKRRERHSLARKVLWAALTDEEKTEWIRKIHNTTKKKPNKQEDLIYQYISVYGFKYNTWLMIEDKETKKRYIPDFVHNTHPYIIEFDGSLGHNINSPYVSEDCVDRNETRNRVYREHGYSVFCIPESDALNSYVMDMKLIENIENWLLEQKN